MRVIGISPLDKDSTVSFLEDGRVVFACGEERLTRVKLQGGFPDQSLALGLARTGWRPADVHAVAYAFLTPAEEARAIQEAMAADRGDPGPATAAYQQAKAAMYVPGRAVPVPGLDAAGEFVPRKPAAKRVVYEAVAGNRWAALAAHRSEFRRWAAAAAADHARLGDELDAGLKRHGLADVPVVRYPHHDTHAAAAFYGSGFGTALGVVLDGYGTGMAGGVYHCGPHGVEPLYRFRFPNSLGIFYEQVTSALGFKPSRHEGKIVGLAAYGDPRPLADALLARFDTRAGDLVWHAGLSPLTARAYAGRFAKRDVAAAYQYVLEQVVRQVVGFWLERTGLRHVVLSGGVHANVKLNQRVAELPGVEAVFVDPHMGDGGAGAGAAMLATGCAAMTAAGPAPTVYHGPDFPAAEVRAALADAGLSYEAPPDPEAVAAGLLAADRIVARFAGRMEYGPRALGNRSVLYPARRPAVNQWLNRQLGRTEFMPFAPACLADAAPHLFRNLATARRAAEFMTVTFDCTEEMRAHSPAAVHVDGTARPQVVTAEANPGFHRLLTAYRERTGIPVLVNTSFNMHEEPIVCRPADAVRAFLRGNLDYLLAGPYLVPHPRLADNLAGRG
jgi:carbamoyltransferase